MTRNQMRRRFIGTSFDVVCVIGFWLCMYWLYSVFGDLRP